MMQSRRREEHGSSGELDVFGATRYFAGLPPATTSDDDDCRRPSSATEPSSADHRLYCFQAKVVLQRDTTTRMATEGNSFRGPHQPQQLPGGLRGHAERHATNKQQLQVVAANKRQPQPSGKMSKLAALLSFMVSPSSLSLSPRASFRKEEKPSTTRLLRRQAEAASAAGGGERETAADNTYKAAANSPSSSSRETESSGGIQLTQGLFGAHDDDDELDLGVATGDRRLQGITVVRGIGGDEERWVVRCVPGPGAWDDDDEHREKVLNEESASSEQNIKDEMVEVEQLQGDDDDGNIDPAAPHSSWDSDSSSDLFDLDLEY